MKVEDQIPHFSLTLGGGWVRLITAEMKGVPALHVVSADYMGGGTYWLMGIKVLTPYLASSDMMTLASGASYTLTNISTLGLGFLLDLCWHDWR